MDIKELITFCEEYFYYDKKLGRLYWKKSWGKKIRPGLRAGNLRKDGRTIIKIEGVKYYAHRLIFLIHHKYLPSEIDHKDRKKYNDRIENLRACTHKQNMLNTERAPPNPYKYIKK